MILVTGGSGQLARCLEQQAAGRAMCRVGRPDFDFDRPDSIEPALAAAAPDLVINAAAWTAVDAAESEPAAAARANRDGPAAIARYCATRAIPLIHISTDYVFDGGKGAPYVETDPPSPIGVYGATKRAGEEAVLAAWPRALVVRTSWVYAGIGKNFVLTMLNARRKADRLRVVADQRGCPTAAPALAVALLQLADRLREGWTDEQSGIYHACGTGDTTWHGLAVAVFEVAAQHGVPPPIVDPIATADWPTPVRRPPDSRLSCHRLRQTFGIALPPWRESLVNVLNSGVLSQMSFPDPKGGV